MNEFKGAISFWLLMLLGVYYAQPYVDAVMAAILGGF